jgi:hypothetical protein
LRLIVRLMIGLLSAVKNKADGEAVEYEAESTHL